MGRKNRRAAFTGDHRIERLSYGGAQKVWKRGREWFVREVPAHRAHKPYTCPGCAHVIREGEAHAVVWSAEDLFGDSAAVSSRRHWHQHCWRMQ